jgi:hypothetical protein
VNISKVDVSDLAVIMGLAFLAGFGAADLALRMRMVSKTLFGVDRQA